MSKNEKSKKLLKKDLPSTPLKTIQKFYSCALPMKETIERAYKILKNNYNLEPSQIMRADCTCADDVNAIQEPENFRKMLGPYKMGGLNGFPFTGAVGMNTYSQHIPENGALFIYYAPHVGISRNGEFGKILRIGQDTPSSSCGAAVGALNNLLSNMIISGEVTNLDYQFNTIEQIFLAEKNRILYDKNGKKRKDSLKEATEVMYEAINRRIDLHFNKTDYKDAHCSYVILMGGILINGDGMESFNDCRRFEVYDVAAKKWRDFLAHFCS